MTFKEFCQQHEIRMLKTAFQGWLVEQREYCKHSPEEWERLYARFADELHSGMLNDE